MTERRRRGKREREAGKRPRRAVAWIGGGAEPVRLKLGRKHLARRLCRDLSSGGGRRRNAGRECVMSPAADPEQGQNLPAPSDCGEG